MRYPNARRALVTGLALAATASLAQAQNPPFNSTLLGQFSQGSSVYADIWADGNIAYLARFGQSQVDIVSRSNPSNPNLLATCSLASPDNGSSAQDVKSSGDGLLFIASESGGSNGVHIVDVRNPNNPQLLTTIDPEPGSFEFIHNMSYDDGWLYICNSSDTEIAILDLRSYNPNSPPSSISSWDYLVDVPGALFIHDITVENGRMYASGWDNLTIWDVSNLGSSAPSLLGTIGGMSNHAVWPTADGAYCVTTDEREGGALRLYELIDNGSSITIQARDSYQAAAGQSFSAHNPVVLGDRVYTSFYQTGGLVFQIDRTDHTLQLVASYDTSTIAPSFFEGNWGAYPLSGEESVLLSDIETGMYLVDFSAIQIAFTQARENLIEVGAAQSVTVEISNLGNLTANTGSVTLMASVNGGAFQAIPMGSIGGNQYTADLPQLNCNSSVNYYVQVNDLSGGTWTNPANAPGESYVAYSRGTTTLPILVDTFQTHPA